MAPRSSITKRWLLNSFGIIVVIMVAMVIGVSAAMHSFYYNSAGRGKRPPGKRRGRCGQRL